MDTLIAYVGGSGAGEASARAPRDHGIPPWRGSPGQVDIKCQKSRSQCRTQPALITSFKDTAMKITWDEWKKFCEAWDDHPNGDNWFYDDQLLPNEDELGCEIPEIMIAPGTKFDLTGGMLWRGEGRPCPVDFLGEHGLDTAIRKWRKLRDFDSFIVTFPKSQSTAINGIKSAIEALGGVISH